MFEHKRVGGIHFFRIGQFGFSCYITKKHPPLLGEAVLIVFSLACYAVGVYQLADILNNW